MSSPADSHASLFPTLERGGGKQMTVISGRKCSALLKRSDPLGSLVKMLLESQQWWSNAGLLRWEARPLCSKRLTEFTDTQQNQPTPLNESALILSQRDMQSNRCLFRLVLSAHHTEEIESSSLPTMLLKTPCAMDCDADKRASKGVSGTSGTLALEIASGYVAKRGWMLPTPNACDYNTTWSEEAELPGCSLENDGQPFRLSPLFTEEMMGFPLMWTTLPFYSENGELNH